MGKVSKTRQAKEAIKKRKESIHTPPAWWSSGGVKVVLKIPPGYINMAEFAKKCGVQRPAISKARKTGAFPIEHMRWVSKPIQPELYFDFEKCGVPWILTKPLHRRPKEYRNPELYPAAIVQNLQEPVDPNNPDGLIRTPKKRGRPPKNPEPVENNGAVTEDLTTVVDLHTAKLAKEKLSIELKTIEVQRARNEVVDIADVLQLIETIAIETRAGFKTIVSRSKKQLASAKDSVRCAEILNKEFEELSANILSTMKRLQTGQINETPEAEDWEEMKEDE